VIWNGNRAISTGSKYAAFSQAATEEVEDYHSIIKNTERAKGLLKGF
jgi:hypothetical protein